jgi:hypothetical protein
VPLSKTDNVPHAAGERSDGKRLAAGTWEKRPRSEPRPVKEAGVQVPQGCNFTSARWRTGLRGSMLLRRIELPNARQCTRRDVPEAALEASGTVRRIIPDPEIAESVQLQQVGVPSNERKRQGRSIRFGAGEPRCHGAAHCLSTNCVRSFRRSNRESAERNASNAILHDGQHVWKVGIDRWRAIR